MKSTILKAIAFVTGVVAVAVSCSKHNQEPAPKKRTPLETPSGLRCAQSTNTSASLCWEAVENALYYSIFLDPDDSVAFKKVSDTTVVITGLEPQHEYVARVRAEAASQSAFTCSDFSSPVSFSTLDNPMLPAPVIEVGETSIDMISYKWNSNADAGSYSYEFSGPDTLVTATTNDSTLVFDNLKEDSRYSFKLIAHPSEEAKSLWKDSPVSQVDTVTRASIVLDMPVLSGWTRLDTMSVSWSKVEFAGSYEYSLNEGTAKSTKLLAVKYVKLKSNTKYTLRVRAIPDTKYEKGYVPSQWAEISFTTEKFQIPLEMPTLAGSTNLDTVRVSWAKVSNAGSYEYSLNGSTAKSTTALAVRYTGLKADTEYTMKVRALPSSTYQESYLPSEWAEITIKTGHFEIPLDAPILTGVAGSDNISVSWTAISKAGSYEYRIDSGAAQTTTKTSVAFGNLDPETEYLVEVRAIPSSSYEKGYIPSAWSAIRLTTGKSSKPYGNEGYGREDGQW